MLLDTQGFFGGPWTVGPGNHPFTLPMTVPPPWGCLSPSGHKGHRWCLQGWFFGWSHGRSGWIWIYLVKFHRDRKHELFTPNGACLVREILLIEVFENWVGELLFHLTWIYDKTTSLYITRNGSCIPLYTRKKASYNPLIMFQCCCSLLVGKYTPEA